MNALYHEDDEAENQPSQFIKYNFFHFIYQDGDHNTKSPHTDWWEIW